MDRGQQSRQNDSMPSSVPHMQQVISLDNKLPMAAQLQAAAAAGLVIPDPIPQQQQVVVIDAKTGQILTNGALRPSGNSGTLEVVAMSGMNPLANGRGFPEQQANGYPNQMQQQHKNQQYQQQKLSAMQQLQQSQQAQQQQQQKQQQQQQHGQSQRVLQAQNRKKQKDLHANRAQQMRKEHSGQQDQSPVKISLSGSVGTLESLTEEPDVRTSTMTAPMLPAQPAALGQPQLDPNYNYPGEFSYDPSSGPVQLERTSTGDGWVVRNTFVDMEEPRSYPMRSVASCMGRFESLTDLSNGLLGSITTPTGSYNNLSSLDENY